MIKLGYIRRLPNGKYRVLSEKGRNMGTYDSHSKAKKRLREIEFFKHKKASTPTYSELMRQIHKDTPEKLTIFMQAFKDAFDQAVKNNSESPEEEALNKISNIFKLAEQVNLDKYNINELRRLTNNSNDITPAFIPQQSFAPFTSVTTQPSATLNSGSPQSNSEDRSDRKKFFRKQLLNYLFNMIGENVSDDLSDIGEVIPSDNLPLVGEYDSSYGPDKGGISGFVGGIGILNI